MRMTEHMLTHLPLSTKLHCPLLSLSSQLRVPPSVETCRRHTPWYAWPMMRKTRAPNPAKWAKSHPSSAGVWRTGWRAPAPSAFPPLTTLALYPGINPAPPSPAPAPTTMTAPSTERAADLYFLQSSSSMHNPTMAVVEYQYCAVPILVLLKL